MKPLYWTVIAVTACLLPARIALPEEPAAPTKERTFRFTYAVTVPAPAEGTKRLDLWVPLPLEDDVQRVADLEVTSACGEVAVAAERTREEEYGNRFVHVGLDAPKGPVSLSWSATITRALDEGQGKGPVSPRFTQADDLVPIDGLAADLAKTTLGDGASASVAVRAKRLYDEVLSTMTYDKVAPGWGKGDFARACEVGKGNCTDFHAKFTGLARSVGIPVRFTMGIPLSTEPKGTAGGYHCWAHYRDGDHWVPVDISEAQKVVAKDPVKAEWFHGHLDPDRVSLTVGRDLTLAPKQKGKPLAFMAYPYVEVDGKPTDVPKEGRSFTWTTP